ncbi:hypothetical protein BJV78DRAFT_1175471 [Lactifluus subvellereus]|nr:hypothetical protein BJV78DRAFT_1175471 [Lactifluus subvellereus]
MQYVCEVKPHCSMDRATPNCLPVLYDFDFLITSDGTSTGQIENTKIQKVCWPLVSTHRAGTRGELKSRHTGVMISRPISMSREGSPTQRPDHLALRCQPENVGNSEHLEPYSGMPGSAFCSSIRALVARGCFTWVASTMSTQAKAWTRST